MKYRLQSVIYKDYKKDFTELFLNFALFFASFSQHDEENQKIELYKFAKSNRKELQELLDHTIFLKKPSWSYEDECRLVVHNKEYNDKPKDKSNFSLLKIASKAIIR